MKHTIGTPVRIQNAVTPASIPYISRKRQQSGLANWRNLANQMYRVFPEFTRRVIRDEASQIEMLVLTRSITQPFTKSVKTYRSMSFKKFIKAKHYQTVRFI